MSLLKSTVTGFVAVKEEPRYTEAGLPIQSFKIAHTPFRGGQPQEDKTMWVRVTAFGVRADFVRERITKGALVQAGGDMEVGIWTTQNGDARLDITLTADYVQLLQRSKDAPEIVQPAPATPAQKATDDDLPF